MVQVVLVDLMMKLLHRSSRGPVVLDVAVVEQAVDLLELVSIGLAMKSSVVPASGHP